MTKLESAHMWDTARTNRRRGIVAVVAVAVVAGVAVAGWIMTRDEGPVAAGDATIEITWTDEGTTYAGDHEIREGTVTVEFSNQTDHKATMAILAYETGSRWLATELDFLPEEGDWGVPVGAPAIGYRDIEFDGAGDLVPGSHTWTMDLQPGTYLFDVGAEDYRFTGLWRAAIIEVVAD